jgi:drug/metabolite transporter (DMT)-like permease
MVTLVVFLFGEGEPIGAVVLLGIFLIIVGSFLIPLRSFRAFSLDRYKSIAVVAALVAAAGTAGYSVTDDFALELARGGRNATLQDNFFLAFYYIGLQGITTVFWQGLAVISSRSERQLFVHQWFHPAASMVKGAGIMLTYGLVLISMGYVTNVSYVVAFRQLSIPIGLVFGILFLQERSCGPKITAVVLLFTGVVLVGLG